MSKQTTGSILEPKYDPVIRISKVVELTGCSRAFIYQKMKEGSFPKNFLIGDKAKGFLLSEVNSWIQEQVAASRSDEVA